MAFQAAQLLDIQTCPVCQGKGCQACGQFGVYAELEKQKLIFPLPGYLETGVRRHQHQTLWIKRSLLVLATLMIIIISWLILVF